jgi:ACS family 4-hydroxyphenylacetate permease-like MFS transporter
MSRRLPCPVAVWAAWITDRPKPVVPGGGLEGLPAVVLGVICFFYLDDGPAQASWLSEEEKREIASRLERDRALEQGAATQRGILSQLWSRNVVLLSVAYFGLVTSLNANSTWVPQIVHSFAQGASYGVIGLLTAFPAVLTVAVMPLWGASSDRRNERDWHLRIAMLVAALGWVLVISSDIAALRYLGLILVSMGSFCGLLIFWTFPASSAILSSEARPAGIALTLNLIIGRRPAQQYRRNAGISCYGTGERGPA